MGRRPKIQKETLPPPSKKGGTRNKMPQLLRGFKDILPSEQTYWQMMMSKALKLAQDYGFQKIDTPLLEETSLFLRSVGKETDIVQKEMYAFTDKGGDDICLRPEGTASVIRAYLEHGMIAWPQPVKLFYWGPMFRYSRPQSGRYRQFYQLGFEILGESEPVLDSQLVLLAYNFFKGLEIEIEIQINSVGCPLCRPAYQRSLINYFKPKKRLLCPTCLERLSKNPLRILDCSEASCEELKDGAPQIIDWLCEECKNHFIKVLEFLDELELPYDLNPLLVRGLDYYTKTAFEIWPIFKEDQAGLTSQSALAGGGRYDGLAQLLGQKTIPASGFSIGIERTILKVKEKEKEGKFDMDAWEERRPDVFIAQLGEAAKRKALNLFESFREHNILTSECFSKNSLKSQLEQASKIGAKYTFILGQKEILDGTILLREMEGGVQEIIDYEKAISEIKKRLEMNH